MSVNVLVVSDIFGYCVGLNRLMADLSASGAEVQLLDPYQGQEQTFADEQQAYTAFCEQCGHEAYAAQVQQYLLKAASFDVVIGFSAGASALWRALASDKVSGIKQALLFYPGQIYPYLQLTPKVPVRLVFGHSEPHFDVAAVCAQLNRNLDIYAQHTRYAHGFVNPASVAFDAQGYQTYITPLKQLLTELAIGNAST